MKLGFAFKREPIWMLVLTLAPVLLGLAVYLVLRWFA